MSSLPFSQPGKFWRGNLHGHSTVSDGVYSPEAVCRRYHAAGYDFISLTEHWMEIYGHPILDTTAYRTDSFTTLIGAELHGPETEMGTVWHLVANGLPLDFDPDHDDGGPGLAQKAVAAGAFLSMAHPAWYTLTEKDVDSLPTFHAVEIFNGVAVDHNDRSNGWHIADICHGRGQRVNVTAADDFHGFDQMWDFERGWVWVKSDRLAPESLLSALKSGHYYSSTGPKIYDVSVDADRVVRVACSPAERVFVTGKGPAAASAGGRGLSRVEIPLETFDSPYARITVRDGNGGRAWTNPIWFDEL